MSDYRAKKNCFGFRGQYWDKGTIVTGVTASEAKGPEFKHFEKVGAAKKKPVRKPAKSQDILD